MFSADAVSALAIEGAQAAVIAELAPTAQPIVIDMGSAATLAAATGTQSPARRELVVVDAAVNGYGMLVDDVLGQRQDGIERQVLVLDPGRDGLAQITSALLASPAAFDALHVIAHASADGLQLGATWLTGSDLDRYSGELAQWRGVLTDDADILFYGCDLARVDAGQQLLRSFANATGADIAASTDLTGAAVLGGDWTLEYRIGAIQTNLAIGALTQAVWTGTLLVNQTTSNQQCDAAVGADAAGNMVVVWQSRQQDGSGWGVYARRFDAAGMALGGEFLVTGTTSDDQFEADVAVDAAGNFVVVWTTEGQNGDSADEGNIYARAFDAAGGAISSEFRVNTTTAGNQTSPTVAFEGQGGSYMIAWASENQDGSGWGVYARKFDLPHAALTAEFQVNTTTAGDQRAPDVAGDAFGNFAFVWQSNGQDGDGWGIYHRYYAADGTFTGGEALTNATTLDDQSAPAIAFNAADDALITWASKGQDGDGDGIYAAFVRFFESGSSVAGEFRVNVTTAADQTAPAIAHDAALNFVVAWTSFGQDADGASKPNIYARFLEPSGSGIVPAGGEFRVNAYQTSDQQGVAVAMAGAGNYVFVWDGKTADDAKGVDLAVFANIATNVAPVVDLTNAAWSYSENSGAVAIDATLVVSDVDSARLSGASIQISTGYTAGEDVLEFSNQLGITGSFNGATGILTLSGVALLADYQTALRSVTYRNTSDAPSTDERRVTVWVSDGIHAGGDVRTLDVQAVNDAPVLSGVNALLAIGEDATGDAGTLVASLISGRVSDVDTGATTGIAVISVDDTHGTWQYTTNGGGAWFAFGVPTAANARLLLADALTAVRFVPNANWNGTVAGGLTLRAWDGTSGVAGGTANTTLNGGTTAFSSASASASITVNAVNDAPSGANKTVTTNEDTAYVFTVADFGFADAADTPANALAGVRIASLPGAGSLRLNAVAVSAGQFIAAADIAAGKLTYLGAANANGAGYASFGFQVRDDGGTAAGGVNLDATPDTITVDIAAVNDAPVNQLPGPQATTTVVPIILSAGGGNGIAITDVDAGAGNVEVTLTATDGVISLGGLLGIVFSLGDGLSDGSITFSGSLTDVNAALDGLIFVADIGFGGIATLTVATSDLGNSGLGGAQLDTDVLQIYVNSVATLLITDEAEATSEDAVLNAASVLANDIDLLFGTLSVIEVNGNAAAIGAAIVLPSGATLTMQANGTFSYDPRTAWDVLPAGATPTDTFSYTVDTTSGGFGYGRVTITVTGANDAPVLSGANALIDISEDVTGDAGTLVASLISGQVNDVDADAMTGIAVVSVDDTHGTWQYTTNGGGAWFAFGVPTAASARLLLADASSAVRFVPNANWSGTVAGGLTLRA